MSYSLKRKIQESLHLLPAIGLVWQAAPRWTIVRLILILVLGILPLVSLYLTKLVIDTITDSITANEPEVVFNQVFLLLILAGAVTLVTTICNSIAELVSDIQGQKIIDYTQSVIQAKAIEVDLEYYENPQYHDTLERAQEEADYRPSKILEDLIQVVQNTILLVTMLGLLLSLHWGIAGILFVAAIPALLVRIKYAEIMYYWYRQWTSMERQAEYLDWLVTGDIFAKEIRLFNLGNLFRQRFLRLRRQIHQKTIQIDSKQAIASLIAKAIAGVLIFLAYSVIVRQTIQGVLKIGDLVLYHQAFQRGSSALQGLLGSLSGLYEDNLFLANLYEFLNFQPKIVAPANPKPVPKPMQQGIRFENVNFSYQDTTRQALKDINLTLHPGETIALVGENGSGKTTLIKLLSRLYDPISGRITIDGIDLRQFEPENLRSQLGIIFQDYVKYYFTARENIWLGNTDIPLTDTSIATAAQQAGADEVIMSLPQGYDTVLGKWFDHGEELSVGQWQKIALARSFIRDSQVIILDEPTSSIDPQAESEIFIKFSQLIAKRTAILISHRLSTVKMADCIYVLHQGSIVESGSHEQLIKLNGLYRQMFETQAKKYQ